ncbi:hypothetical protein [Paractinoplanes rishiriensis]|uniref:NlpC/P60 domain-containing protein n=1 Tax=Paractinoplanes rishiriensis TaxID=1050105 RepID=A0A919KDD6_9ACTN|nr:hypothetical protein [Actinoplanes rishiriensis]GIF02297.1 hypothetical protein Ari01nite_97610 [Actinoplanes rishiriensis]
MTTRVLYALFAVAIGTVALCATGGAMLLGGGAGSPCTMPLAGSSAHPATVRSYDSEQVANAATIISVGATDGIPVRGWVIAVAVALQESTLYNIDHGDRDSLGLFQQRPSQGWGTPIQLLDPIYASRRFYQKLVAIPNWQNLELTDAGQRVQISAYPDAYAKWEPDATMLVTTTTISANASDPSLDGLGACPDPCLTGSASYPSTGPRGCIGGAPYVLARAETWLHAWGGGPVPYLSSGNPTNWFRGYRRDCSGYVSMALGLDGPGLNTAGLANASTPISKQQLRAGDLLINTAPDLRGHVVLFDRWTDATKTSYLGYEQSGDGGTHHRAIPFPYFGRYPMGLYRLRQ